MIGVTYAVIAQESVANNRTYITYGIAAYANPSKDADQVTTLLTIADVTSDQNAITELVKACNQFNLSTIHLYDVVEDFLAQ